MTSFYFTHCVCVLFDAPPELEPILAEVRTRNWPIVGQAIEGAGEHGWALCGPGVIVELGGGMVAVLDVVARPWPDELRADSVEPTFAEAWHSGGFGPRTTAGALARAADQPWLWDGGVQAARGHRGFVRLRTGRTGDGAAPIQTSDDRDPAYELTMLTELAREVLRVPGALALFVPEGEALRSPAQVEAAMAQDLAEAPPPFELWSNLRAVALVEDGPHHWLGLDVVGMPQLGLPDHEAVFASGEEDPGAVEALVRRACAHLLAGQSIPVGATAEDPRGRRWRMTAAIGLIAPRRPVLRWLPEQSSRPSDDVLAGLAAGAPPPTA